MELTSPKVTIQKPAQYIFESLCDVRNFEKLMPENTSKFEVLGNDSFIFGLKGMPEIELKVKEKTPPGKVVLGSASDKLAFLLTTYVVPETESSCEVQLYFEGEFNAMMA